MSAANIVHQFEERKIVARHPDEVRQKNQERAESAEPDPFAGEEPALPREQQRAGNRKREKGRAIFVFHSDPDEDTEPEPVAGLVTVDRAHDAPRAREPDQRLERIHREPMMHQQKDRRGESGQRGECLRKCAPAEVAREFTS